MPSSPLGMSPDEVDALLRQLGSKPTPAGLGAAGPQAGLDAGPSPRLAFNPLASAAAKPDGATPFAAPPAEFTPRFVQTGMPGIGQGTFANTRDEEIAALAQQTATRTAGNISGTGFGASGDYYTPNGAGFGLHAAQLGQAAGSDVMRLLQGSDATTEAARQAEANRQADIAKAQIAGTAHVAGAQAAHSPDALRGAGNLKLLDMIAQGNVNPENIKLASEFLGQLHGGQPAAAAPRAAGVPGVGNPGDVLQRLQQVKQGREGVVAAANVFGQADPNGGFKQVEGLGPQHAEQFADQLVNMPAEQRAAVMRGIMEGRYGPRQPIIDAMAQAGAANAYLAGGYPTDMRSMPGKNIPGTMILPFQGQNLFSLGTRPTTAIGNLANRSALFNAGVPYNQLTFGGRSVPFDPGLIGSSLREMGLKPPVDKGKATNRAGVLAEILSQSLGQQGQ